jgi:hypothetical protein
MFPANMPGKSMVKFPDLPDDEEFSKFVKQYETEYANLDILYLRAVQDFGNVKLNELTDFHVESILRPYLLKWGRMGRVLGYKGCRRIAEKLGEIANQFCEFQNLTLVTVDIIEKSDKIGTLNDEILNAKWKTDKGRTRRVGPTATSKVLHLVNPDLFMIWDSKIRKTYGFKDSGAEYVCFLSIMQNWSKKLGSVVKNLQFQYGKSIAKIIDEYNWKKCWC